jgi:hypothetical protein
MDVHSRDSTRSIVGVLRFYFGNLLKNESFGVLHNNWFQSFGVLQKNCSIFELMSVNILAFNCLPVI